MKVILELQGIDLQQTEDWIYNKDQNSLTFRCKNRKYSVKIEESLYTYIKVKGNDIELINKEGVLSRE